MKNIPPIHKFVRLLAILSVAALAHTVKAQDQVYYENFDTDTTPNWVVNKVGGSNTADIFFDYSTVGIPAAPHSAGTTRGLKLQANLDPAIQVFPSGVTVSPSGFSITDNFEMRFDWWLNFNGPLLGGGNGATQIAGAGYGTAGTSAQVAGTVIDSVFVGASGDGTGTSFDYRVYSSLHPTSYQDADRVITGDPTSPLVYFAGTRNNSGSTYYTTNFLSVSAPAAQVALFPQQTGTTQAGSLGFAWHDISLKKVANTITYTIDGHLIATVDARDAGALGGGNVLFTHFDINITATTDPNAKFLAFSLVDNVRITNFPNVVGVDATTPNASEAGPTPGVFTITRTAAGVPLTVNYTITGTASNGVDYVSLPGSVTFAATATSTNITVTPINDSIPETTETIILTINESSSYTGAGNATIKITDNETPQLTITPLLPQMYERGSDYASFKISRLGDLTSSFTANLAFTGTATMFVDYSADNTSITFNAGDISATNMVRVAEDTTLEGNETIICTIAPASAGEYAVGSPSSATITLVDDELAPETILFSDDFTTDTSANWNLSFASNPDSTPDYISTFGYDYGNSVPPAPHSPNGDTLGLYLTVNKNDTTASAAALNLYPATQNFTGNFALRFDMYLINGAGAGATEYALFGINHSGTKTNWFHNETGGVGAGWTFDGLFYAVEADGAGLGDYANFSSPTTAGNNPTPLSAGRSASTLTGIFKAPPWAIAGAPGNLVGSSTPMWADVEISKVGSIVTLTINKTEILTYTNVTAYTSGNIMLGYVDAYNSVGPAASGVIYDNVRVIRLASSAVTIQVTQIQSAGSNVQINFTADSDEAASAFKLQSTATVSGTFSDAAAVITKLGTNTYQAVIAKSGATQFYRIKR